jgi:lysophospholipase L1-like esterase
MQLFAAAIFFMTMLNQSPAAKGVLVNSDFARGLEGWTKEGKVSASNGVVQFGTAKGAIRQVYKVGGLQILWFGATLKPTADASCVVRLQCLGGSGELLLDLSARPSDQGGAAIYLKTHAQTTKVLVSIEKTSEGGSVDVDDALLLDDDRNRIEHQPNVNLDLAMEPVWKGSKIVDESVLLLDDGNKAAQGRLLFKPTKISTVRDSSGARTYVQGKDFRVHDRWIEALPGSKLPTISASEMAKGKLPWTRLDGRHIFVTYEHQGKWKGPVPARQSNNLPFTSGRLKARKPTKIVAYGDSITLGVNVSGFLNVPPYLPPWPALVAHKLGRHVQVINMGLGGMNSVWAKDNARDLVASLHPDLVLIAFGMNDFWSVSPDEFEGNIKEVIASIRAVRPDCEFLLVAPMKFDPAYTSEAYYHSNFNGYAAKLSKMAGPGVGLLDMAAMTDWLYRQKSAKDLTTDPLHPDDFLARIYAQGVVHVLGR